MLNMNTVAAATLSRSRLDNTEYNNTAAAAVDRMMPYSSVSYSLSPRRSGWLLKRKLLSKNNLYLSKKFAIFVAHTCAL